MFPQLLALIFNIAFPNKVRTVVKNFKLFIDNNLFIFIYFYTIEILIYY